MKCSLGVVVVLGLYLAGCGDIAVQEAFAKALENANNRITNTLAVGNDKEYTVTLKLDSGKDKQNEGDKKVDTPDSVLELAYTGKAFDDKKIALAYYCNGSEYGDKWKNKLVKTVNGSQFNVEDASDDVELMRKLGDRKVSLEVSTKAFEKMDEKNSETLTTNSDGDLHAKLTFNYTDEEKKSGEEKLKDDKDGKDAFDKKAKGEFNYLFKVQKDDVNKDLTEVLQVLLTLCDGIVEANLRK